MIRSAVTICLLFTTLTVSRAQASLRLSTDEVNQIMVSFCSLYSNHISSIKTHLEFHLHQWRTLQNNNGQLEIEGECSRPIDLDQTPQTQKGEAFHFVGNLNTLERIFELRIEFTHGVGTARFVKEAVFDEGSQSLRPQWKLQTVTLVPTPYEIEKIKGIPIIQWVLEAVRPMQQTNYRLSEVRNLPNGNTTLIFHSMRDLFTLGIWTENGGAVKVLRANMATAPQFAWGNVSASGEKSDAVFWGTGSLMWGCSNYQELKRGGVTLEGCMKTMKSMKK